MQRTFPKVLCVVTIVAVAVVLPSAVARGASTTVVISEFRTRGPVGASDEFVELYNLSTTAVDVGGWKIRGSNSSGGVGTRVTIPTGTMLGPGCHYLLTNSGYSGGIGSDLTYATGFTDDGGVGLTLSDDSVVDEVGMSAGSAFKEGTPLTALTTNDDQGYERKPGSTLGSGTDTDDNAQDFTLRMPSAPQNSADACVSTGPSDTPTAAAADTPTPIATDTLTATATDTATATATATETPTPTATGTPTHTATPTPTDTATATATLSATPTTSSTRTPAVTPVPDRDHDGVMDVSDNCRDIANPDQTDHDGDDVGDVCDNCPSRFNPAQSDGDGNRIGDVCEDAAAQSFVVRRVRLRASPAAPRKAAAGRIVLAATFDASDIDGSLAEALRNGVIVGVGGAGLPRVEKVVFPGVRCFDFGTVVCVNGTAVLSFRPRPHAGGQIFDVRFRALRRRFRPPLSAETVAATLSLGGIDRSDDLTHCRVARGKRGVACWK